MCAWCCPEPWEETVKKTAVLCPHGIISSKDLHYNKTEGQYVQEWSCRVLGKGWSELEATVVTLREEGIVLRF